MQIAVYCASSTRVPEVYQRAAEQVGEEMGRRGLTMVNGAGNIGLMKLSADACLHAGGQVVGVIPTFMIEEGWAHEGLTRLVETPTMEARKAWIERETQGAIVLAGGVGTMDELFEILTLKQLGLYLSPIVILNTAGYYDHLFRFLERAVEERFMRPAHRDLWCVATEPREAVDLLLSTPLWDASVRRLAKI